MRPLSWDWRRGRQDVLGDRRRDELRAARGGLRRAARVRHGVRPRAQDVDTIADGALGCIQSPADRAAAPARAVGDRRLGPRVRLGIDEQPDDLQRRDPVHQRVMDLADHPDAPVLELRHEADLPQRARTVQRRRQHGRAQRLEGGLADAVGRIGELDEVRRDVEAGVLDPARLGDPQRRLVQAPARPRHLVHAPGGALAQRRDRRPGAAVLRSGEHRAEPHVHGRLLRVEAQERAVEGRQAMGGGGGGGHAAPPCPAALSTADRFS